MPLELKMVMLNIGKAVAHLPFAGRNLMGPQNFSRALDFYHAGNRLKFRVNDQFRAERTVAEFGAGQVEIISLFKLMVGELVSNRQADAQRRSVRTDEIDARDFRLLATVFGICRHNERFPVRAQHRAVALVDPFRRDADLARCGAPAFDTPLEDFHAVIHFGFGPAMHGLAIFRAAEMRKAGARDQATRRFDRVIRRRKQSRC